MNEERNMWQDRFEGRRSRGLIWGLALAAGGGFWLLGNLDIVPEPARIILPGLMILWGVATLITGRGQR